MIRLDRSPSRAAARPRSVGLAVGLALAGLGCSVADERVAPPSVTWSEPEKVEGLSFTAPRRPIPARALASAAAVGANWLAVIPYGFVRPEDPIVRFDTDRQFWGESSEGVATTIAHARAQGLRVLLKPHLWVRGQGWPGEFLPEDEAGWDAFLSSYRDYALTFARLADSLRVPMFSLGTEVDLVALERPSYWRDLASEIRTFYDGRLTYAANWDKYERIEFWDALDLIGVDAYFPLVSDDSPTVDALVAAWEPWERRLAAVARRSERPILFTEFGYRSIDGAAGEHWELPDNRDAIGIPPNFDVQSSAYEAFFRAWWDRPWLAGGFLWKWHAGAPDRVPRTTDFSPQGKPAETVLADWYGGRPSLEADDDEAGG